MQEHGKSVNRHSVPHGVGKEAFVQDQDGRVFPTRSGIASSMELSREETASWMWLSHDQSSKADYTHD